MLWVFCTAPIHGCATSCRGDTLSISGSPGLVAPSCTLAYLYDADASFGQPYAGIASSHDTCGRVSDRRSSTWPCNPYRVHGDLPFAWPAAALAPVRCPPPYLAPHLATAAAITYTFPARVVSYSRPAPAVHDPSAVRATLTSAASHLGNPLPSRPAAQ